MNPNPGLSIQKQVNNIPASVAVNDNSTAIVAGTVYQAGFIEGHIQSEFKEINVNDAVVGKIVQVEAGCNKLWLLSKSGSVFAYDYTSNSSQTCSPPITEIYTPAGYGGDKAIKITSGRDHVVILTKNGRVFGSGDNSKYQLVPQGQTNYNCAVELLITDTNIHDNNCCNTFVGVYNKLTSPVLPGDSEDPCQVLAVNKSVCDYHLGWLNVCGVTVECENDVGVFNIPVFGDLQYVGFLSAGKDGCVLGSITYTINKLYIKCGVITTRFTTSDRCGTACTVQEYNSSSTKEVVLFDFNPCAAKALMACMGERKPLTGNVQVSGKCGGCAPVSIPTICIDLPKISYDAQSKSIILTSSDSISAISNLCGKQISGLLEKKETFLNFEFDVNIPRCPVKEIIQPTLPQPKWKTIGAGFDQTVLVDNCDRAYVLGNIHEIRSNANLLRRTPLDDLLSKVNTNISFPADQLNCSKSVCNDCACNACSSGGFKTDFSKFGISLSLPRNEGCTQMTACDFLANLKKANEKVYCENTCEPCDNFIYLNLYGDDGCSCGAPTSCAIGSVVLYNKQSISKLVSVGRSIVEEINVDQNSQVEFDQSGYCVDSSETIPLDTIIELKFCNDGPKVNIFLDTCNPGGIRFTTNDPLTNVEFNVDASSCNSKLILNYGSILDPTVLTNLKYAFSLEPYYPNPGYKNPFNTRIINTYLKGGDHVRFVTSNPINIRLAVTADVPTVFRFKRRILDMAIGDKNLAFLLGGLSCPADVAVIGSNCYGELGIGSNETVVCWKYIDRCIFIGTQVSSLFAGPTSMFFVTQNNKVYGSGSWHNLINSREPEIINEICPTWKVKDIAISKSTIVLFTSEKCFFGLGDNRLGQLGLGNCPGTNKFVPLQYTRIQGNPFFSPPPQPNQFAGWGPNGNQFGPNTFQGPNGNQFGPNGNQFGPNGNGFPNGPNGNQFGPGPKGGAQQQRGPFPQLQNQNQGGPRMKGGDQQVPPPWVTNMIGGSVPPGQRYMPNNRLINSSGNPYGNGNR